MVEISIKIRYISPCKNHHDATSVAPFTSWQVHIQFPTPIYTPGVRPNRDLDSVSDCPSHELWSIQFSPDPQTPDHVSQRSRTFVPTCVSIGSVSNILLQISGQGRLESNNILLQISGQGRLESKPYSPRGRNMSTHVGISHFMSIIKNSKSWRFWSHDDRSHYLPCRRAAGIVHTWTQPSRCVCFLPFSTRTRTKHQMETLSTIIVVFIVLAMIRGLLIYHWLHAKSGWNWEIVYPLLSLPVVPVTPFMHLYTGTVVWFQPWLEPLQKLMSL